MSTLKNGHIQKRSSLDSYLEFDKAADLVGYITGNPLAFRGQLVWIDDEETFRVITSIDPPEHKEVSGGGGGFTPPGNPTEVLYKGSGGVSASPDLTFDGTELEAKNLRVSIGGDFRMGSLPNVQPSATVVGTPGTNNMKFAIYHVIAENAAGNKTGRGEGITVAGLPNPLSSSDYVEVTWPDLPDAVQYEVYKHDVDYSDFSNITDEWVRLDTLPAGTTTLIDDDEATGTVVSVPPAEVNNTQGEVTLPTAPWSSGDTKMLVQDPTTGKVTPHPQARIEDTGSGIAFTFGQRVSGEAVGKGSFVAGGLGNIASAENTFVSGNNSEATAPGAVALGSYATVTGRGAFAAGYSNNAKKEGAIALGTGNNANQRGSIALGNSNTAGSSDQNGGGDNAFAAGYYNQALGDSAHAVGERTKATNKCSSTEGYEIRSRVLNGRVVGLYNEDYAKDAPNGRKAGDIDEYEDHDRIFAVGIGDQPGGQPQNTTYYDGIERADGFYVTYRAGTHVRNGLTIERFQKDETGTYIQDKNQTPHHTLSETVLSIGEEIAEVDQTEPDPLSEVLVRNPSTKELEYVAGTALVGNSLGAPGSDRQMVFNDGGTLGASPDLTFENGTLSAPGLQTTAAQGTYNSTESRFELGPKDKTPGFPLQEGLTKLFLTAKNSGSKTVAEATFYSDGTTVTYTEVTFVHSEISGVDLAAEVNSGMQIYVTGLASSSTVSGSLLFYST